MSLDQDVLDLTQNLEDITGLAQQLVDLIAAKDAAAAALANENAALVAAANISAAEKAALTDKMAAALAKSIAAEDKLRAAIPGVPPVGATPLDVSYPDKASFDAAVGAYTGVESVTLDGAEVHAATDTSAAPANYFTHSADGHIDTSGPTD